MPEASVADARRYLEDGGLGEVIGLTSIALEYGQPKVQSDTDMAMALCLMASDSMKLRSALQRVVDEDDRFRRSMSPDADKDPVTLACEAAKAVLEEQGN